MEATISINGMVLGEREAMVVRVAVMALGEILTKQRESSGEGGRHAATGYQSDIDMILAMIEERRRR